MSAELASAILTTWLAVFLAVGVGVLVVSALVAMWAEAL